MRIRMLLLSALATLPIAACATYQELSPQSVPTTVTPGSEEDCKAACANGRTLRCEFSENTPDGGTCEAMCRNAESSGYTSMHPACVAQAKSCEQADDCANQ